VGISVFPEDGDQMEALLKKADRSMYAEKSANQNAHRTDLHLVPR
jgi:GGDEF domain-containing protein